MTNAKIIREKIAATSNTKKITKAMEMVAASKMRKSQLAMQLSRPYAEKIIDVISHVAASNSEYKHPYLVARDVVNVGVLIISSDRGLCGGLNNNLFKLALYKIHELKSSGYNVKLFIVGKKAESFFKKFGLEVLGVKSGFANGITSEELFGITRLVLQSYDKKEVDSIRVFYNKFINTMSQQPTDTQLLPIVSNKDKEYAKQWDYIYEPEANELLNDLLTRYIDSTIYQAVVENVASEQSARMVAMKSATDNANDLIKKFQLSYNKARQASITQEISEIVGGAAAV